MEFFSKFFLIATTGLFLIFFMLLFENPKRAQIGIGIFVLLSLLIIVESPFIVILITFLLSPALILLDHKKIGWRKIIIYLIVSVFAFFLIGIIINNFVKIVLFQNLPVYVSVLPLLLIPIVLFVSVYLAKKSRNA